MHRQVHCTCLKRPLSHEEEDDEEEDELEHVLELELELELQLDEFEGVVPTKRCLQVHS